MTRTLACLTVAMLLAACNGRSEAPGVAPSAAAAVEVNPSATGSDVVWAAGSRALDKSSDPEGDYRRLADEANAIADESERMRALSSLRVYAQVAKVRSQELRAASAAIK